MHTHTCTGTPARRAHKGSRDAAWAPDVQQCTSKVFICIPCTDAQTHNASHNVTVSLSLAVFSLRRPYREDRATFRCVPDSPHLQTNTRPPTEMSPAPPVSDSKTTAGTHATLRYATLRYAMLCYATLALFLVSPAVHVFNTANLLILLIPLTRGQHLHHVCVCVCVHVCICACTYLPPHTALDPSPCGPPHDAGVCDRVNRHGNTAPPPTA